ncbi:prephenate dehydratase [candidate division KSB1 bacterium]|nr:prephenate dehydratase [candidate division KSB1 bacterium]
MPLVAFQGAHYAFSEIAANRFFGQDIKCIPCFDFDTVFAQVENNKANFGIIPVENSLTGSIHRNVDLLLEHDLMICGEVLLRIEQHLIGNPGVTLQEIKTIYSHPQALEQCRSFISSLKHVETVASYDTAGSVKMIRDHKMLDAAAIASKWAANDYGMQILKEEIEDIPENFTRFLVISKEKIKLGEQNKTSIIFSFKSIPGALFKCLSVFALRDIDLLKIESRPLRGRPWEYIFYLDFAGNMEQEIAQNAIRHLEEITSFLKVLGSYPSGNQKNDT